MMPADDTDDTIVAKVLSGDTPLFAMLVQRHQRVIRRVASGLLDPPSIENIVQQTFVNAFERLRQYEPGRDFGAWLRAIAANLVRMELRRRGSEQRHLRMYFRQLEERVDESTDAAERSNRLMEAVAACRQTLAGAAAQAVGLRYDQALGIDRIAAILGRSELATRQLLFRARVALKNCVEQRLNSP
jgi:RNA polymerase sigma-70 factor, ECF subfamily